MMTADSPTALRTTELRKSFGSTVALAGSRADPVSIEPSGWERTGFDVAGYRQQANLAREGLDILKNASPERRQALEEIRMLREFLAECMPRLLEQGHVYRAKAEGGD